MDVSSLLVIFAITLAAFGIGIAAMAIGRMVSGRCLRGSCAGSEVVTPDGESLSCATCPNRHRHGR